MLINVCSNCDVKSIREAVLAIAVGGEVVVEPGTYFENKIIIDRSMKLSGKPGAVIDGQNLAEHIIIVSHDDVTIQNLTLQNTGTSYIQEVSAIRILSSKNCQILNNRFENTTYAIYFEKSDLSIVKNNIIKGSAKDESSGGNGIHIWTGSDYTIEGNDITGHRDGIYFEFVKSAKVLNNTVHNNIRYGLHFMSSHYCEYRHNVFSNNESGVAVMYSRFITMDSNRFEKSSGAASYGLLLKDIYTSEITNNIFEDNTVGVFMESTNRTNFLNNQYHHNGWAMRVMGDCDLNIFKHNNITENTFDVATNSDHNLNTFSENYWSQYEGYDLNHDGIGDVPYRSVSLSSVILERLDSSFVLLKSFLFILLDSIERGLPTLIPGRMEDTSPLMKKWSNHD
ncbi:MAG: nitrous oxide reductase family maturation protein NosD, partial [Bdellovibrionales bacterium]